MNREMFIVDNSAKVSTAFGALITIFVNITQDSLMTTMVLAACGAVSSFVATMTVKWLMTILKKYLRKKLW